MNNEKLIELVREHSFLYDQSHRKYSDNQKKDQVWNEIGIKLNFKGKDCKKAWALLRDAFRRAVKKKKYNTKTGKANAVEKKWKYDDEMSFLLPFLKERDPICPLPTTEVYNDEDTFDMTQESPLPVETILTTPPSHQAICTQSRKPKRKIMNRKKINEIPSTVLMRYILENRKKPSGEIDKFFDGIATTVKTFSPRDRAAAKASIFKIVSEMEMDILSRPTSSSSFDSCKMQNSVDTDSTEQTTNNDYIYVVREDQTECEDF